MSTKTQSTAFAFATFALLSAGSASAALFDTMDSVDTLKVIAAQKAQTTDRMPAGKVTDPAKDDSGATSDSTATDSKN